MKKQITFLLISFTLGIFSQKDSLQISKKYLEDQLYISISYNVLNNQPDEIKDSNFSYGISTGFIRDIPLNQSRTFGIGLGLGYGYDSFNHGLKVSKNNSNQFIFEQGSSLSANKLTVHNIEIPFQIRWRNSTLKRYDFWRIYAGFKVTYNFNNKFTYTLNGTDFKYTNIEPFNKWQTGFSVSAGYDAFTFYFYYGFSPILKNAVLTSSPIKTGITKFGLIFYIL